MKVISPHGELLIISAPQRVPRGYVEPESIALLDFTTASGFAFVTLLFTLQNGHSYRYSYRFQTGTNWFGTTGPLFAFSSWDSKTKAMYFNWYLRPRCFDKVFVA